MIYIFSSQKPAALGLGDKAAWAVILKIPQTAKLLSGYEISPDARVYLDIRGLSPAELKKAMALFKKNRAGSFLGIIDPKGEAEDPALFFFEGCRDYISSALVKRGLGKNRFAAAEKAKIPLLSASSQSAEKQKNGTTLLPKTKLPAGKFEGWKALRSGTTEFFLFLFVAVSKEANLASRVGEATFKAIKDRLRDVLQQAFAGADALLWMETDNNSLFLVPPRAPNARATVEAGLKLIVNSRLISLEKLGLSFPVDFTIALHYGKSVFRAPGKTGELVSEPVNYIFHLGTKKAEPGRLTISGDVPEEALPEGLLDIFTPAGLFEDIPTRHSRRFIV